MVYLGDFLGHIIGELTMARAQADGESIRLAEFYADHQLLRHFPVPRMRLQDVQLDVQVLVVGVEDSSGESGPRGGPDPADTALVFDGVAEKHLAQLQLTQDQQNLIRGALSRQYQLLRRRQKVGLDASGVAELLTKVMRNELKALNVPEDDRHRVSKAVLAEAREELQLKAADPARVRVGVETSEIRDTSADSLLRVSLKVSEEAVEWSILDQDRGVSALIPE